MTDRVSRTVGWSTTRGGGGSKRPVVRRAVECQTAKESRYLMATRYRFCAKGFSREDGDRILGLRCCGWGFVRFNVPRSLASLPHGQKV